MDFESVVITTATGALAGFAGLIIILVVLASKDTNRMETFFFEALTRSPILLVVCAVLGGLIAITFQNAFEMGTLFRLLAAAILPVVAVCAHALVATNNSPIKSID